MCALQGARGLDHPARRDGRSGAQEGPCWGRAAAMECRPVLGGWSTPHRPTPHRVGDRHRSAPRRRPRGRRCRVPHPRAPRPAAAEGGPRPVRQHVVQRACRCPRRCSRPPASPTATPASPTAAAGSTPAAGATVLRQQAVPRRPPPCRPHPPRWHRPRRQRPQLPDRRPGGHVPVGSTAPPEAGRKAAQKMPNVAAQAFIACGLDGGGEYALGPVEVEGATVSAEASAFDRDHGAGPPPRRGRVNLTFDSQGC